MKKNLMILAMATAALVASCSGKNKVPSAADADSTQVADTTAQAGGSLNLDVVAGTYEGTIPAADGPGLKTVVTIKADSTYQWQQDMEGRKDGHDEASGVYKVMGDSVLMLVRPSSGEHTFLKVKDGDSVILTDSLGNEPEGETAKLYVLKKRK